MGNFHVAFYSIIGRTNLLLSSLETFFVRRSRRRYLCEQLISLSTMVFHRYSWEKAQILCLPIHIEVGGCSSSANSAVLEVLNAQKCRVPN